MEEMRSLAPDTRCCWLEEALALGSGLGVEARVVPSSAIRSFSSSFSCRGREGGRGEGGRGDN